jgi:hypothetical protein
VPKEEMCKGIPYPLRTTEAMKDVYNEAMEMDTVAERDELLKGVGLRGIEVCGSFIQLGVYLHHILLIG